jgi:hypothetical protein
MGAFGGSKRKLTITPNQLIPLAHPAGFYCHISPSLPGLALTVHKRKAMSDEPVHAVAIEVAIYHVSSMFFVAAGPLGGPPLCRRVFGVPGRISLL